MFSRLVAWLQGVWQMLSGSSVKRALNVDVALSSGMAGKLELWARMYRDDAPWLSDTVKSLGLPAAIASELARAATIEMAVAVTGSARATWLSEQMMGVVDRLREQLEKGNALGGLMFKPYVDGEQLAIDYVPADQFYPVRYDSSGHLTEVVFAEQIRRGDSYYTRLEYHAMSGAGCAIRNRAFRSSTADEIGSAVPLTAVDEWASLAPDALIEGIDRPLFAYFRFPLTNNVDPASPLGVSCFSRAEGLIRQADEQWGRFLWEFESGERAVYVDELAFRRDKDGRPLLPNKRLYRTVDAGGERDDLFQDYTPTLREENILRGLNAILRQIEFKCGLAYGTLSEPQYEAKTATEIRSMMQRSYVTITDIQKALETALDGLLYAMDIWATWANLAPRGAFTAAYTWDDSVISDRELQMAQDRQAVGMGVMPKYQYLMRNYKLDEATARRWIEEAQGEQPDLFGFEGANA